MKDELNKHGPNNGERKVLRPYEELMKKKYSKKINFNF